MRITNHFQCRTNPVSTYNVLNIPIKTRSHRANKPDEYISLLPIDQFFSEPHRLVNGDISTNPLLSDSADSIGHFMPTDPEHALPSDTPVEAIHGMVVSKYVSTPCEVAKLASLKPNELDFKPDFEDITSIESSE